MIQSLTTLNSGGLQVGVKVLSSSFSRAIDLPSNGVITMVGGKCSNLSS